MKTKFRVAVTLTCAAVCVLLTSGCALATWAKVAKKEQQRIEEEEALKRLQLPPAILAAIDPKYYPVDKAIHLDSLFVACRERDGLFGDQTRYIYYDPKITYKTNSFSKLEIEVEVKKDGVEPETFHLENRPYVWIKFPEKAVEMAGTEVKSK